MKHFLSATRRSHHCPNFLKMKTPQIINSSRIGALLAIALFTSSELKAGASAPSMEEVKAIAEEGFIYGLPLVMGYTANYQFWIDKTSAQYKAPLGQLYNERRVFTP